MAGADPAGAGHGPADDSGPADGGPTGTDAAELIAQIRQLAASDPAGVQQVVADVLAALDRAAGGALREQLPDGFPLDGAGDEPGPDRSDLDTAAAEQYPAAPA